MGPRMWKKPWSRLFKGKAIKVDRLPYRPYQEYSSPEEIKPEEPTLEEPILEESTLEESYPTETNLEEFYPTKTTPEVTPKLYFDLTTRCMEQVYRVSPIHGSFVPKINQEQCKYLASKLQLAIQSARSIVNEINAEFLSLVELADMVQLLGIFKLLYAMGVEVEDLFQSCCQKSWIQSAIMLTSMSQLVASIGFNLEVCTIFFSAMYMKTKVFLIHFDATRIHQVEAEIVKAKADLDEAKLMMDLKNVIESNPFSSQDWQLATFLRGRLEMKTLHPSSTKARSEDQILPPMMSSLKQMQDCLGRGAFGSVHKAMWLGVEVAKKTFYGPSTSDFLREAAILDGLNHPNIVSLLWSITDGKRCHLVMELMDGDLFSLMQKRMEENGNQGGPFSIPEALELILQIGEGMLYLHEKRIVHRDLKSHNILIKCGKVTQGYVKYLHVKVADFGLSKTKERSATYSDLTLNVGTTRWMAPEAMRVGNVPSDDVDEEREAELNYPFKIDIYSFAMVCYEILTGEVPFSSLNHSEVKKAVLSGDRPLLPRECPDKLKTLIEACWSAKSSTRPNFCNICEELRDLKYSDLWIYWRTLISLCLSKDMAAIDKLVAKLSSPIAQVQQSATIDIYRMAVRSFDHRIYIKEQEAMPLLVSLSYSRDCETQERAIAALQALSIDDQVLVSRRNGLKELFLRQNNSSVSSLSKEISLCLSKDMAAIDKLVAKLSSPIVEVQWNATIGICVMAVKSFDHRIYIKEQEAMPLLVSLSYSRDCKTREHAITALQALSVDDQVSISQRDSLKEHSLRQNSSFVISLSKEIYLGSAVGPIVEVLKSGRMKARENAAEALMKLSSDLGVKVREKIRNSGAVPALVTWLQDGSAEKKEYAAIVLFRTCCSQEDYGSAIQVGIVPPLMNLIAQQYHTILDYVNIVDDAFIILATLAEDREGLIAIAEVGPTSVLVKYIASGRNSDRVVAILRRLCLHDPRFVKEARESNVVERLTVLAQNFRTYRYYTSEVRALLLLLQEPKVDDLQLS